MKTCKIYENPRVPRNPKEVVGRPAGCPDAWRSGIAVQEFLGSLPNSSEFLKKQCTPSNSYDSLGFSRII